MMLSEEMVNAVSLVKSSNYRYAVLKAIGDTVATPSELAKKTKLRLNHVSMVLKELKEANLAACLNENAKKGRLYTLTEKGKNVVSLIQ